MLTKIGVNFFLTPEDVIFVSEMETIAYILGGVAAVYVTVEIHLFFMRRAYGHSDATSLFSGLFARKRRPHWLTPEEWEEEKWRKKT